MNDKQERHFSGAKDALLAFSWLMSGTQRAVELLRSTRKEKPKAHIPQRSFPNAKAAPLPNSPILSVLPRAASLLLRTLKSQTLLAHGNPELLARLPGISGCLTGVLREWQARAPAAGQWPRKAGSTSPLLSAFFFLSSPPPAAVLKAEQAAVFKFPLAPLGCSGLGSALLAGPGMPGTAGAPHLPLELQLRGKLEAAGPGEAGAKAKKGRRSRTVFTELQLMGLEKRFEKQKYLSTPDR